MYALIYSKITFQVYYCFKCCARAGDTEINETKIVAALMEQG